MVCHDVVAIVIPKIEEDDFVLTNIEDKESKNQYVVGDKVKLSVISNKLYDLK